MRDLDRLRYLVAELRARMGIPLLTDPLYFEGVAEIAAEIRELAKLLGVGPVIATSDNGKIVRVWDPATESSLQNDVSHSGVIGDAFRDQVGEYLGRWERRLGLLPAEAPEPAGPALTATELDILEYLDRTDHGESTQADIVAGTGWTLRTVQSRLPRLRGAGYISTPEGRARRGTLITPEGRKALKRTRT